MENLPPDERGHEGPKDGRCNAKYKNGRYCWGKPHFPKHLGGNGRCRHHGGTSVGPQTAAGKARVANNGHQHGIYAKILRESFRTAELKQVFDESAKLGTDLSIEIQMVRARIAEFRRMKESGAEEFRSGDRVYTLDDLLERALAQLGQLTTRQHMMHPEAGAKGNMSITVRVEREKKALPEDAETPDLDVDASAPELEDTNVVSTPEEEPEPGLASELGLDEE